MVVELPGLMDKIIATPGLQIIATLISTFQNDCVCVCVCVVYVSGEVSVLNGSPGFVSSSMKSIIKGSKVAIKRMKGENQTECIPLNLISFL